MYLIRSLACVVCFFFYIVPISTMANASGKVSVAIDIDQAEHHLAKVLLNIPNTTLAPISLKLPTWRTGKYEILNLSNGIRLFNAKSSDGKKLMWRKTDKNTWEVIPTNKENINISYQLYANQLGKRTRHIDDSHAFLNMSSVVLYNDLTRHLKHELVLKTPAKWNSYSGLNSGNAKHTFVADNYDQLVDAPVETGINEHHTFEVDKVKYELVIWGKGNYNSEKIVKDLSILAKQTSVIWQNIPFKRYLFIVHATSGARGATEHHNSTIIQRSRYSFHEREDYIRFLATAAHELIHAWNVKQYRPQGLYPYDYQHENYTNLLWLVEGSTSYFQYQLLLRGKLITIKEFFKSIADRVVKFQHKPGRETQSIAQASFNKWQEQGGDYDNNYSTNIYAEGYLTSWLLDFELLNKTDNKVSFRKIHQWLYEHYRLPRTYNEQDVITGLSDLSGESFTPWWQRSVNQPRRVNFDFLLKQAGLEIYYGKEKSDTAWTGLKTKQHKNGLEVSAVERSSPAWQSGLTAGDIIIALDGLRVVGDDLSKRLQDFLPNQTIKISFFRRDQLQSKQLTLGSTPKGKLQIKPIKKVSKKQALLFEAWTGVSLSGMKI